MRVIPVIDLKEGAVVRGVGGRREEYRRVETVLTRDVSPAGVAHAFASSFDVEEVYVADLDAIAGQAPNWRAYKEIGRSGLKLFVDAGVSGVARAVELAEFAGVSAVIVGLESLQRQQHLREIVEAIGVARTVFSLDLKDGRALARFPVWRTSSPEEIAAEAVAAGVAHMIVLDLAFVGESRGVGGAALCRRLHERFPHVELIGGGGVRSLDDARSLADAGCRAILMASALHTGEFTSREFAIVRGW